METDSGEQINEEAVYGEGSTKEALPLLTGLFLFPLT